MASFVPSQSLEKQAPTNSTAPTPAPNGNPQMGQPSQQEIESGAAMEPEADQGNPSMADEAGGGDADMQLDRALGALSPESQELLAMYLTPEFAGLMKELLGEQVGAYFEKRANPETILIPLNRQKVMEMHSQGQEIPGEVDASVDTGSEMPSQGTKESPRPGHSPAGTAPQPAPPQMPMA